MIGNRPTIAFSIAILALSSAGAQTQRSGGGETQKIMQQYQQVAAEKTALQAQQAQAKKDLEAAQVEIAALKKERDALKSRSTVSAAQSAQLAQLAAGKESTEKSLEQLKQRTAGKLVIFGSGELIATLIDADLIDEYLLMIHPIVLGEGHRLFAGGKHTELRLIDTVATTTGVLIATAIWLVVGLVLCRVTFRWIRKDR